MARPAHSAWIGKRSLTATQTNRLKLCHRYAFFEAPALVVALAGLAASSTEESTEEFAATLGGAG